MAQLYQAILTLIKPKVGSASPTMLFNESKSWNWLVVSSEDPTKVAATVKGIAGAAVIFFAYFFAYFLHSPNLNDVPDQVYTITTSAFGIFSGAIALAGLVRKLINTFKGSDPSAN